MAIDKIRQVYHSRAFLVRWFPIVITAVVVVFLVAFLVIRNAFSDEVIIGNDGYFLSSDSEVGVLKQDADNLKAQLATVDVKSGDTIYRSLFGSYFSADRANPISFKTPQFIGDGTTIANYNEDVNLIDTNLGRVVGYKDVLMSYGKVYDLYDFTQMESSNYLLLGYEDNTMVNLYDLQVQTLNGVYNIPVNSFVYFAENYINYYARTEDGFYFNRILGVDNDSTLTFRYAANNEEYVFSYSNFLSSLGTVYLQYKAPEAVGEEAAVTNVENSAVKEVIQRARNEKEFKWVKPTVTDGDFSAGVFSARNKIEVNDPAGVITNMPTYTFSTNGKVALRRSFAGTGDVLVGGLNAATTYDIVGQYTYLGSDLKTQYLVTFYVGTITTLGLDALEPIEISYDIDGVYPNKISLSNVTINSDLTSEAILGIGKIGILVDGTTYALSTKTMNELLKGSPVSISTSEGLKSNQWYDFTIEFYDRVGNVLPANGNTGKWHTSKNMPSVTIRTTESNAEKVSLQIKQKNDDMVEIGNYYYVLYDSNGGVVEQKNIESDNIDFTSLSANQLYTIKVFGSYDIEDGNGYISDRLMGQLDFATASLSSLGFVSIYYSDKQITQNSISLNFKIQQNKTNAILKRLLSKLYVEVYDESGANMVAQKIYEGEELSKIKNGDLLGVLFTGLDSETNYKIKTRSLAVQGDTYYEADCIANLEEFKTNKKAARVYLENSLVTENMIDFDVIVDDPDGAIISDKLRVELRDMNSKLVDADNILLNSGEPVRLTYNNLTKNQNYTVNFYVDEYNETDLGSTYKSKYELLKKTFYTDNGISGGIELVSSTRQANGRNLADLNSTAKWIENANSNTTHHTVDDSGNLHLYSRSGSSTYTYDLSEYSGKMVKVSFKIKAVTPSGSGIYMTNHLTGTTSRQYSWRLDDVNTSEWKNFSYVFRVGSYMAFNGSTDVFLKQTSFLYGKNYSDTIGFYIGGGTSEYVISDYQIQLFAEEDFGDATYGIEKGTWNNNGGKVNDNNLARVDKLVEIEESAWYSFDFYDVSNEYRAYFRIYNSNGTVYKNYGYYDNGCMIYVPEGKKIGIFFQRANGYLEPEVNKLHLKMTKNVDNTSSSFSKFSYNLNTQVKVNIADLRGEITNNDYYIKAYDTNGVEVFSGRYDGLADTHVLRDVIKTIDCPEGGEYVIELGFKIRNRYYALNSFELSTVDEVNGVGSVNEFRWIQPYGSYVIQNDLNFGEETFYLGYDRNYFNGTIDYQGHTMTLYTISNAALRKFYQVGTAAKMKNLVLDIHVNHEASFYNEGFITYLRGSVENLIINVYEERTESVADYRFVLFSYYLMASGEISNFIIHLKNDLYVYNAASILVYYNRGTISNGYVYGADMVADKERNANRNIQFIEAYGYTNSMVSNVYILSNIRYPNNGYYDYTGLVAWETYGDVENVYVVGDTNKARPSVGPIVGYKRGMSSISNVYYMSDTLYTSSFQSRINALSLNSPLFQKSVLSEEHFNIDEMLEIGYYPQLKFSSNSMPKQEYISLPKAEARDIEVISTDVLEQTNDSAKVQMVISNPYGETIEEVAISNVTTTIESQYYTDGNSYVTLMLTNPQTYRSRYSVRRIKTSYSDGSVSTKTYNDGEKNINLSFYRTVASVDDFAKIKDNPYDNYSIVEDLDFYGYTKNYFIETFYGKIKGNGHTLNNISVTSNRYGLINDLYGQIFDLVIENYRKTNYGAAYNGIIGITRNGASLSNIQFNNVLIEIPDNASGNIYIGGVVGYSDYTRYENLSVNSVKIISNATIQTITVGGLVGYFYYGNITNTFVRDLDISISNVFYTNGIGGLVGYSSSSESFIENTYATGSIESNCIMSGGLVGANWGFVTNSYSAVDISSYLDNIGGIVGRVYGGTIERNLYVGNIYTYYTNGLVGRVTANSAGYTGNFASTDSLINGVKSLATRGETLLSRSELVDYNTYKNVIRMGDEFDYTELSDGVLPKLYYQGTKVLLPGQDDVLIEEEEVLPILEMKKLSQSIEGSRLQFIVDNPNDYIVTGLEIEDMTLNDEKFQVSYDMQEKKTYIIATVSPNRYYDSYRLSKIYYKENSDGIEKAVEKYFKIEMQFYHRISTVEDWQNIDATDAENYMLTSDLDFSGVENPKVNVPVNRLITDGDNVRYTIRNLNLAYTTASNYEGLIRRVVVEMKNINFDNITISDMTGGVNSYINIININYGNIRDCDFSNVEFNAPNKNYVGIIGANSGKKVNFINLSQFTVKGNDYVAGLVAWQDDSYLEDIVMSDSNVSGRDYVGGVAARTTNASNFNRFTGLNVDVSGRDYIGGLVGTGRCNYCVASNMEVTGNAYVGGIFGSGGGSYDTVKDSNVEGFRYVGGNCGYSNGIQYSYLIDSNVFGNNTGSYYVGGIAGGASSSSYLGVVGSTIRNLGSSTGGIVGRPNDGNYMANVYVNNSEVDGEKYVGGIVGSAANGHLYRCVVGDTNVIARNEAAGGIIGLIDNGWYSNGYMQQLAVEASTVRANKSAGGIVGAKRKNLVSLNEIYSIYFEGKVTSDSESNSGIAIGDGGDEQILSRRSVGFYKNSTFNNKLLTTLASNISTGDKTTKTYSDFEVGGISTSTGEIYTDYYNNYFAGHTDFIPFTAGKTYDLSINANVLDRNFAIFYYDSNFKFIGNAGSINGYIDKNFATDYATTGSFKALRDGYFRIMVYNRNYVDSIKVTVTNNDFYSMNERQLLSANDLRQLITWSDYYSSSNVSNYDMTRLAFSDGYFDFSPIAYEEKTLTVNDLSGNGCDGNVQVSGITKKGFTFDGKDDYIKVNNFSGSTSFTVSAKIRHMNTSNGYIFYYGDPNNASAKNGFGVNVGSNQVYVKLNNVTDYATNSYINVRSEATLTVTYDGQTLKTYIDGVLTGTRSIQNVPITPSSNAVAYIGYAPGKSSFSGIISNVMVYDRALSATEVGQNFRAAGVSVLSGLKLYYDLTSYNNSSSGNYPQLKYLQYQELIPLPVELSLMSGTFKMFGMAKSASAMKSTTNSLEGNYHVYTSGLNVVNLEFDSLIDGLEFSYTDGDYTSPWIEVEDKVYSLPYDFENDLVINFRTDYESDTVAFGPSDLAKTIAVVDGNYYHVENGVIYRGDTSLGQEVVNIYDGQALVRGQKVLDLKEGTVSNLIAKTGVMSEAVPLWTTKYDSTTVKAFYNFSTIGSVDGLAMREAQLVSIDGNLISFRGDGKNDDTVFNFYNSEKYLISLEDGEIKSHLANIDMGNSFDNAGITEIAFDRNSREPIMLVKYNNGYVVAVNYANGETLYSHGSAPQMPLFSFFARALFGGAVYSTNNVESYSVSKELSEEIDGTTSAEIIDILSQAESGGESIGETPIKPSGKDNATNNIIAYDARTNNYEVVSTGNLVNTEVGSDGVIPLNQVVETSTILYDFYYPEGVNGDEVDENKVVIYGIIIAVVVVNVVVFSVIFIRKARNGNTR